MRKLFVAGNTGWNAVAGGGGRLQLFGVVSCSVLARTHWINRRGLDKDTLNEVALLRTDRTETLGDDTFKHVPKMQWNIDSTNI